MNTKYHIIAASLAEKISENVWPTGSKIPSIRNLAAEYGVSKNTISQALSLLEKRGFIYSRPQSGYYVTVNTVELKPVPNKVIDFASAIPDWHEFPYKEFQHCLNKGIERYQVELFQYGTLNGLPSLLTTFKKFLMNYQIFTTEDQMVVVAGVQQALAILTAMIFPNNREGILVEQPTYHLYMEVLKLYPGVVTGIERTIKGIDFEELERLFASGLYKFFYTMPRFHNPLGTSYTKQEKLTLLELAERYDVYLVEDDYLADFDLNQKNDSLYSLDTKKRVIYLKSFAKIMFPGLRIGLALVPPVLFDGFNQMKRIQTIDSSMISQAALEIYINNQMFSHYQKQLQQVYLDRGLLLQKNLATYFDEFPYSKNPIMHSVIELPREVNLKALVRYARESNILISELEENHLANFSRKRLLAINISDVEPVKIGSGLKKLRELIEISRF